MPIAAFAPQAEFGTQAETFQRRVKHRRFRCIERGQQIAQARDLFFELNGVGLGIKSHALNQPNLITNRIERITSAGFSSRPRPDSNLIAVQEMKPKAMPLAMEYVNGMASVVTTTGAATVMSSQSISARPHVINTATNSSAGAVANAGTLAANGEKKSASRNRIATPTAARPVRPPALTPAADSM